MAAVMNIEDIRQTCVENGGYRTPCLNDKLYLHFKGYKIIKWLPVESISRGMVIPMLTLIWGELNVDLIEKQ